jgi:hypothetical protein
VSASTLEKIAPGKDFDYSIRFISVVEKSCSSNLLTLEMRNLNLREFMAYSIDGITEN